MLVFCLLTYSFFLSQITPDNFKPGRRGCTIKEHVIEYLSGLEKESFTKKPVVRIKLTGKIDTNNSRIDLSDIITANRDRYILSFRNSLNSREQDKNIRLMSELMDNSISVDSMGLEIMKNYADKVKISFDYRQVFELLAAGRIEDAENMILELPDAEETKKDDGEKI